MSAEETLKQAHHLAAASVGELSLAIARRKMTKRQILAAAENFKNAAGLLQDMVGVKE